MSAMIDAMDRIVSWNLCERPGRRSPAWDHMGKTLRADLGVVQEAIVPVGMSAASRPSGIAGRDRK